MERKYYLRGLGLGIAVTAIIMGVLTSHDKKMTDQEIMARAKELGMVENTVLSDMNETEEQEPADPAAGQEAEADPPGTDKDDSPDTMGNASDAQTEDKGSTAEDPSADTDGSWEDAGESGSTGKAQEGSGEAGGAGQSQTGVKDGNDNKNGGNSTSSPAVKTITVSPGDGSHTVAQKLAEAGIVSSADNYDDFLCRNGYDKKLRTGTFSIPMGASDEQIARIVTGAE